MELLISAFSLVSNVPYLIFKFQYGATNIEAGSILENLAEWFKFQYGATNIYATA